MAREKQGGKRSKASQRKNIMMIATWIFFCFAALAFLLVNALSMFQPTREWGYEKWIEHQINPTLQERGYQVRWESRNLAVLSEYQSVAIYLWQYHARSRIGKQANAQCCEWKAKTEGEVVHFLEVRGFPEEGDWIFVLSGSGVQQEKRASQRPEELGQAQQAKEKPANKFMLPSPGDARANNIKVDIFPKGSISGAAKVFPFIEPGHFVRLIKTIKWGLYGAVLLSYIPIFIVKDLGSLYGAVKNRRVTRQRKQELAVHKAERRRRREEEKRAQALLFTPLASFQRITPAREDRVSRLARHAVVEIKRQNGKQEEREPSLPQTPSEAKRRETSQQRVSFVDLLQGVNAFLPPEVSSKAVQDTILVLCRPGKRRKSIGKSYAPFEDIKGDVLAKHNRPPEFDGAFQWLTKQGVIQRPSSHLHREGGGGAGVWSLNVHPKTAPTQEGKKAITIIARALAQKDRLG